MKIIGEILRPPLKILYLEPFFGCNYRCLFCLHRDGTQIEPMELGPLTFEKLKPVLALVDYIHLSGLGEPLLNPHLLDYLRYFREQDKSFYINTNGSLLTEAHFEVLTTSKSELSVSLDAGDRQTYGKIRQEGQWGRLLARLKRLGKIKASRKAAYPLVYLTFHINTLNLLSLKKVPELAGELGLDGVRFSWTMLPETHRAYSLFNHQKSAAALIQDVSARLQRKGIEVRNEAVFGKHLRGCWSFTPMAFVGANGTVAACCSRWLTIGHLDGNDFEDIWNGRPRRKIGLDIINGRPEGTCAQCAQIRGVDYLRHEEDFVRSGEVDAQILAEKTRHPGPLPALAGLAEGFHAGTAALIGGKLQAALRLFAGLDKKFPDFFEIKNNLAVAHFYLGQIEQCRELLHASRKIPHNERLIQENLDLLARARSAGEDCCQKFTPGGVSKP